MVLSRHRDFLRSQRVFAVAVVLVLGWPFALSLVNAPVQTPWILPQVLGMLYVLARLLYGVALVCRASYVGLRTGYDAESE